MKTSKANYMFLSLSILISTWFYVGICQDQVGGGGGGDFPISSSLPCIQKLIPCQPILAAPSSPPPNSCCRPLNALLASPSDTKCLCTILDNPIIMKSFNVTKDDAFKLAKACGASSSGDSLCQMADSPAPAPPSNGSNSPRTASPPPKKSAANGISCYPVLVFGLVLLLLSVF